MNKLITIAAALMLIGGGCVAVKPNADVSDTAASQQDVSEKSKDNFSKKLKCKGLAEDWYEGNEGGMTIDYAHMYHEGMDTCIVYMHTFDFDIGFTFTEKHVVDLLTGQYILYYARSSNGGENTQFMCDWEESPCVSWEEFSVEKDALFAE